MPQDFTPEELQELQRQDALKTGQPSTIPAPAPTPTPSLATTPQISSPSFSGTPPDFTPAELAELQAQEKAPVPAATEYTAQHLPPSVAGQSIEPSPPKTALDYVNDTGRMLGSSFSGTFDYLNAAKNTAFGTGLSGPSGTPVWGGNSIFSKNLQNERWKDQALASQYPSLYSGLGTVGGAALVAALAPDSVASAAASTPLKWAQSALYGAGLNGVQGALTSPDPTDWRDVASRFGVGAAIGGTLGAVAPTASYFIGKGATAPLDAVRGYPEGISRQAATPLLNTIRAAGPTQTQAALAQYGPNAMLGDTSKVALGMIQSLANKTPETAQTISDALTTRSLGTPGRIFSDMNSSIGPPISADEYANMIKDDRAVEHQKLPGVFAATPTIDPSKVSPIMDEINSRLTTAAGNEKTALIKLQKELQDQPGKPAVPPSYGPVPGTQGLNKLTPAQPAVPATLVTNPEKLQNIKSSIDLMMNNKDNDIGILPGPVAKADGSLGSLYGMINNTLRDNVPGYGDVMDQSAAYARKVGAIKQGYNDVLPGGNNPLHPDTLSRQLQEASTKGQPEIPEGLEIGARAALYRDMGTNVNDLAKFKNNLGLAKGQTVSGPNSFNQDKLSLIFGKDKTNALIDSMDKNQQFQNTFQRSLGGSDTQPRQQADKWLEPPKPFSDTFNSWSPQAKPISWALTKARNMLGEAIKPNLSNPVSAYPEISKVLTAQGPQATTYTNSLVDALRRRGQNAAFGSNVGNSSALISALLAQRGLNGMFNPIPPVQQPQ